MVAVDKKRYTLAGDFTAANASYGRINEIWIGLLNMVRGERMVGTAGLLLLQPYDPEKIPVIFVHGLLSSAYVWRNTANSLTVDPEIRRRYQFWVFSYPTGNPIAYSALLLRQDLAYAEQTYHFKKAILIGHSMGGLLSRLQVANTGHMLWDGVFGQKADALYASQPPDSLIKTGSYFLCQSRHRASGLRGDAAPRQFALDRRYRSSWHESYSSAVQGRERHPTISDRSCGT
jgi:pimeloyl-ACP methyl ester carboxylesterase